MAAVCRNASPPPPVRGSSTGPGPWGRSASRSGSPRSRRTRTWGRSARPSRARTAGRPGSEPPGASRGVRLADPGDRLALPGGPGPRGHPGPCGAQGDPARDRLLRSRSISRRRGIEGAVPGRVTERAAVAFPKRAARRMSPPKRTRPAARPPTNASPAPVVSTARTLWLGRHEAATLPQCHDDRGHAERAGRLVESFHAPRGPVGG